MENKFNIKIEGKNREKLKLRFYSCTIVKLKMKDVKFFFAHKQFDKNSLDFYHINLNNSVKIIELQFPNSQNEYSDVTFLLKKVDEDSNLLAVRVNLITNEVEIKETDFKI